jgi:hypothetical protein
LELQQLEMQQLVVRNRELELQLKVHKLAQATLRAAEAEGARWCAPRLSFYKCRRCLLKAPDPRAPLSRAFVPVCCVRGPAGPRTRRHNRAYRQTDRPTV